MTRSVIAAVMSAMTTEHVVMQTVIGVTISESGQRASIYMISLSSSLVAMGFVAQSPGAFVPFVATVLPAVFGAWYLHDHAHCRYRRGEPAGAYRHCTDPRLLPHDQCRGGRIFCRRARPLAGVGCQRAIDARGTADRLFDHRRNHDRRDQRDGCRRWRARCCCTT